MLPVSKEPALAETASINDSYIGDYTSIDEGTLIHESVFGDYSYIMENCQVMFSDIGKFCSIASYVRIHPVNHPFERTTTHHMTYRREMFGLANEDESAFFEWRRKDQRVTVGHDVWIGHNAIIMPKVNIGHGAVVGSGSIVTKDLPPYSIAVGNPAQVIKYRFDERTIEKLLEVEWWNWSYDDIRDRFEMLIDVNILIETY